VPQSAQRIARLGHVEDPALLNDEEQEDLIQQIIDMRRGADLLLAPKVCSECGKSFTLLPNKPGRVNTCPKCSVPA
jgi:predicted Zn-ribbon and HTH transcriptional regulator